MAGSDMARLAAGVRSGLGRLLLVFMTVLLAACGTETDSTLDSFAGTPPPTPSANAAGRVTSASTSAAISGATVSLGDVTATTDAAGNFSLLDVTASGSAVVHVTAPGYMDAYVITNTVPGFTASVSVRLLPVAETTSITASTGGVALVAGTPAEVSLGANVLADAEGTPVTGPVTVAMTPINMQQSLSAAPGDYTDSNGSPIEGFGGLAVTATDGAGAPVALAAGQTATIRIPYSSRSDAAALATVDLFHFDGVTGRWVQGGAATLGGIAPNQYYEGSIDAFGSWAAGSVINPVVYLSGCVVREGTSTRVAGVRVESEGISYSGRSAALTDASGNFRMAIKANSSVIVNGIVGNYVTNTLSAAPSASDIALPQCLSLAALAGAPRITLTWGAQPEDVDSHVFAPDGTHVYYVDTGTLADDPYIKLDVDDTTSYGPEVVTITRLMVGTYTYAVHNYSGTFSPDMTGSPVRVELRRGAELEAFTPTLAMGETSATDFWTVFSFTVDAACNVTVTPINSFAPGDPDTGPSTPARPAPVARQYCTAP